MKLAWVSESLCGGIATLVLDVSTKSALALC